MSSVHSVFHPSSLVFLTKARDRNTDTEVFADLMRRIGYIMAHDVLSSLLVSPTWVKTPLDMNASGAEFDGRIALVPVMRAGDILLEGFRAYTERPLIWHISIARDEETTLPHVYGVKVPQQIVEQPQLVVVLEVMLATGGSAVTAIDILKERGAQNIVFVCVVAAPEGIERLRQVHPDVDIYTIVIDDRLTDADDDFPPGYIMPGLGDAGDRSYPTK